MTNLNLYPNSAIDPQAQLILNRSTLAEKYLHVVAVDRIDNVGLSNFIIVLIFSGGKKYKKQSFKFNSNYS